VYGNESAKDGGGVYVIGPSEFTMQGGASVSGNSAAANGGGVFIAGGSNPGDDAKFTMQGSASVSGNTAAGGGGGVYVTTLSNGIGNFFMEDYSLISGNQATGTYSNGGGVFVSNGGDLELRGGTIYGNETTINPATLCNTLPNNNSGNSSALGISGSASASAKYGDGGNILPTGETGTDNTIKR
jgi:predicted outer membrane repeat protein